MTTTTPTISALRTSEPRSASAKNLWRTGVTYGAAASVATLAVAAGARAADISLEVGGEAIPVAGFAQLSFVGAVIGTMLAVVFARRAAHARRTFVHTTLVLTVLSIVPDALVDAQVVTKVTLALTHVIAAAIVIPALASRLTDN
jgi:hypothetical protein